VTTDASGTATFTDLVITGTTGAYTLQFSAPSLTGVTSGAITLSAGAPSQIDFFAQPDATATSGVALDPEPVVRVRDASGNNVPGEQVTATLGGSPAGASLSGTLVVTTAANGRAAFTNLAIAGPAGTYNLIFTAAAGTVSSPASNNISLSAEAVSGTATAIRAAFRPLPEWIPALLLR
jgi:hypothetical protein